MLFPCSSHPSMSVLKGITHDGTFCRMNVKGEKDEKEAGFYIRFRLEQHRRRNHPIPRHRALRRLGPKSNHAHVKPRCFKFTLVVSARPTAITNDRTFPLHTPPVFVGDSGEYQTWPRMKVTEGRNGEAPPPALPTCSGDRVECRAK